MKSWIRNVVLLAAAVAVLGLPANAFGALAKNSVGTKQLKNGAVTTKKLKKQAVTAAKVKKNSLTGAQINESKLGTVPNADTLDGLHASDFARAGTTGGTPTGPAGGALAGTYPNPMLNILGEPCPNGKALIDVTSLAQLICGPGVYIDEFENLGVTPEQFPSLEPFVPPPPEEQGEGIENTAVGQQALLSLTTGDGNSAFGRGALESNTTEGSNSAFGDLALQQNTTGEENSAFGWEAMINNTGGDANSALGWAALEQNTTGESNSAVGARALAANTKGNENSALGGNALLENTEGENNTAAGWGALFKNETGNDNSAFGHTALFNNATGNQNTAVGKDAMGANTTGKENVAVGAIALEKFETGEKNIALGVQAGSSLEKGNDNIYIGSFVGGPAEESNTIRIGTLGNQNEAFLQGVAGTAVGATNSPVLVNPQGKLGTTVSSRRVKTDIHPVGTRVNGLMRLNPVTFRYRRSVVQGPNPVQFGLIAEQVAKVYPNLVVRGPDGRPESIAYQEFPALLLAQAQRQHSRISRLHAQIRHQQAEIDWLLRHARR